MVRLRDISKSFGGVTALHRVRLDASRGEIHGLLGENGAGKTTLMKILSGFLRADSGTVEIDGSIMAPASPARAIQLGVGMVHQHFNLAGPLTVSENMSLGAYGMRRKFDPVYEHARILELSAKFRMPVDPSARVADLPVGLQQRIEILKALCLNPKLLILDEPTAILAPREADDLLKVLKNFARGGKTVILISHKQKEILKVCDRVTILQKGSRVAVRRVAGLGPKSLAGLMMGHGSRARTETMPTKRIPKNNSNRNLPRASKPRLIIRDLKILGEGSRPGVLNLNLRVRGGEVVAITGLEGSGVAELEEGLFGLRPIASGSILTRDKSLGVARKAGHAVGFIPSDRQSTGLIQDMNLRDNLALAQAGRPSDWLGMIRTTEQENRGKSLLKEYKVSPQDLLARCEYLSGGNRQRLLLARELADQPELIIAANPTRGLDMASTRSSQDKLSGAAGMGAAVLLLTADLDEAQSLGDRLFVMWRGRMRPVPRKASRINIGRMMLGEGFGSLRTKTNI